MVLIEAQKTDLKSGFGQCIAEMVAAQRFNQAANQPFHVIYGSVSNGTQWQFLRLQDFTVAIDLTVYPLPPIDTVLANLVWMAKG